MHANSEYTSSPEYVRKCAVAPHCYVHKGPLQPSVYVCIRFMFWCIPICSFFICTYTHTHTNIRRDFHRKYYFLSVCVYIYMYILCMDVWKHTYKNVHLHSCIHSLGRISTTTLYTYHVSCSWTCINMIRTHVKSIQHTCCYEGVYRQNLATLCVCAEPTCIAFDVYIYMYIYIYTYACICMYVCMHVHMYVCIHTYIHAYVRTNTYIQQTCMHSSTHEHNRNVHMLAKTRETHGAAKDMKDSLVMWPTLNERLTVPPRTWRTVSLCDQHSMLLMIPTPPGSSKHHSPSTCVFASPYTSSRPTT